MQAIVEASGPSGLLRGVYLQAQGPEAPLIIVIPGSGPTDCNGNSPLGLNASVACGGVAIAWSFHSQDR